GQGGQGILLPGVPGVPAAKVVILGGGVAGTNAGRMAMGMEAYVTVIDRSLPRLYELDLQFGSQLHTLYATVENIEREVVAADLVIGAVLIPGASAPKLVSREMVRAMRPGSVLVDIAIDQGGCCGPLLGSLRSARLDAEVGAAVLGPALLGVLTARRLLLAVADDRDAVGPHAVGDEVVHRGLGPAIAEGQVVFAGATLVGVTLDQDQMVGVRLEPLRIGVEHRRSFRADLGAIERKVDVLQLDRRNELTRGRAPPHPGAPTPRPGIRAHSHGGPTTAAVRRLARDAGLRRARLRRATGEDKRHYSQQRHHRLPSPSAHGSSFGLCRRHRRPAREQKGGGKLHGGCRARRGA